MAAGRREESRLHCINQSIVIWGADKLDIEAFLRRGHVEPSKPVLLAPALRAAVDRKIDEYYTTGRITIDS